MSVEDVVKVAIYSNDPNIKRNLRKGLNKHTESYAYGIVLPLVEHERDETFALRVAGLIASHELSQNSEVTFGGFVKRFGDESLEKSLLQLVQLPQLGAIESIHRLLTRVESSSKGGFDWFGLVRRLERWGNGVSDESLKSRQSILRDYYRVIAQNDSEPQTSETKEGVES